MPNLGAPELIVILVVVVLLFGARKLPELGSSVGKSIKNFRKGMAEAEADPDDQPQSESASAETRDS